MSLETLTSVAVGGARSATPLRPFRQVRHTLDAFSPARREFESNYTGSVPSSRVLSFRCSFTAKLHRLTKTTCRKRALTPFWDAKGD